MSQKHLIITTIFLLLLCNTASATTYTVCASGCDYTTIQAAENAAGAGDTVYVYNGTYSENIVVDTAYLTIQGEGMDVVNVTSTAHVFDVDASYVNITGMNITGAATSNANIHLEGNYDYCNFSYNRIADCYDGIVVRGSGNDHNLILNNTFTSWTDAGIMVRDTSYTNTTENYLHHGMWAIYTRDTSTDCFVFGNWVKHIEGYGLVQLGTATDLTFYDNWVENCSRHASGGTVDTSWNITKRSGNNIFGGSYIGGNYWDDYAGVDNDWDGLGNTALPYTNGGNITNGGDYLPLCTAAGGVSTRNCAGGDICVNTTHWWRDDAPINSSSDPIAAGIGAAAQGQTIYIFNGSYTENVIELDTSHLTVKGEGRNVVHVTPTTTNTHIFYIHTDANYFNISGVHGSGGISGCIGLYFYHVTHGNVTNCNFSNCGTHGIGGEHGNYMRVVGNIAGNNTLRGISFPYYANHSYFADNIIMDNGGRGLDICTHGDDSTFKNNTVLRNGIAMGGTHYSGINTHWSNNILYDECRSQGNYGFRDHLIRNDANNITIRNPVNPVGESFDFDIEDNDCGWKIENTDGQIFTENSSATAYSYPSNFSMHRENVIEKFTVTLVPMTLVSGDDQVSVTSISYNNVVGSEKYNITADCTDTSETVTYTATVANASETYGCYVGGVYDHTETAVVGVVTWSYTGGFASSKALSIMWRDGGNNIVLAANKYGMLRKDVTAAQTFSTIAGGFTHDVCFTWWDDVTDSWLSYWVGDSYNSAQSIPEHESYFVLMDGTGETVSCSVAAAETVAIPTGWSSTYLRESTSKTLTAIKSDMGGNCADLYTWDHTASGTGAWTNTGAFSVLPNQGLLVSASAGFNWDGSVP